MKSKRGPGLQFLITNAPARATRKQIDYACTLIDIYEQRFSVTYPLSPDDVEDMHHEEISMLITDLKDELNFD